jgi:hypothetical protein
MDLMRARKPPPAGITLVELAYRETFTTDRARITLIPAGHVLGSAQVLVETEKGCLLYTVYGFTEEFAADLRYLGMDALALGGGNQLELLR